MNYTKPLDGMRYELIGPDPFQHKKTFNNLAALKKRRLAEAREGISLLEPILTLLFRLVYTVWHQLLRMLYWLLTWTDSKLRELADV